MDSKIIREKYIKFFQEKGHQVITPAPLVLEGDPTTLFNSAGMQPLVPFLKGAVHPNGTRLVDSQPCFRSQDIEEIGDNRHTTFFEMLGNWSLGDYFKKEQLSWVWEFMTEELKLPKERLSVSVYEGDHTVGKDTESLELWKNLGIVDSHIYQYPANKSWWSLSGTPEQMKEGEIGGPDSEIFYEFTQVEHDKKYGDHCHPNCDCGRFLEICNSVFIQYQKQPDGSLKELPNKNVDFGGGLERLVAATNNDPDIFKTDLYQPLAKVLEKFTDLKYSDSKVQHSMRVIIDHLKASVFLILNGVIPANKLHGYILRRLLRRAAVKMRHLHGRFPEPIIFESICGSVLNIYQGLFNVDYQKNKELVFAVVSEELVRFSKTLERGLAEVEKIKEIDGKKAFDLYQTFGFPYEVTEELFKQKGQSIDQAIFKSEFQKHKELSRTASAGMFKGGLSSMGELETKYHSATHLLHQSLRIVLGKHVIQRGSNITPERMRFDFSHPEKLTTEQIKKVEDLVNEQIQKDLVVSFYETSPEEAIKDGAIGAFGDRYGEKVKVYSIGEFSKEICGGPHVEHSGVLGRFKINKQESVGAGIRRIYATL